MNRVEDGGALWLTARQKVVFAASVLAALYLLWAAILGLLLIEPTKGRLQFAAMYAVPVAVELLAPETEAPKSFCSSSQLIAKCRPVRAPELVRLLADDRYRLNEPIKNSLSREVMPSFVIGNLLCRPISGSLSVICLSSYVGLGPNGEEIFFCDRDREDCFFPELAGVRYPYG